MAEFEDRARIFRRTSKRVDSLAKAGGRPLEDRSRIVSKISKRKESLATAGGRAFEDRLRSVCGMRGEQYVNRFRTPAQEQ